MPEDHLPQAEFSPWPTPQDTMKTIDSDNGWLDLIEHLRRNTPLKVLNYVEARDVFRNLEQLGYQIGKPSAHPSSIETTEEAITPMQTGAYKKQTLKPINSSKGK
jgi:hypothetical protein